MATFKTSFWCCTDYEFQNLYGETDFNETMEKFCLKWNDFQVNVSNSFSTLRKENDFYDVSLVSDDDQVVSAHKVVLSASSKFFKSILRKSDHSKPMIYLSGVESTQLNCILDYIYEGEVQLYQEDLDKFLDVAKKLKIYGLIEGIGGSKEEASEKLEEVDLDDDIESFEESSLLNEEKCQARKKESFTKKSDRIVSVVAQEGTNVYEEAKRAVDDILIKDGDNWVCKVCNKSSKKSNDMRRHAEVHIEGLSFPCQLCGDIFRSRQHLFDHKRRKH